MNANRIHIPPTYRKKIVEFLCKPVIDDIEVSMPHWRDSAQLAVNQTPSSEFTRWMDQVSRAAKRLADLMAEGEHRSLRKRANEALQANPEASASIRGTLLSNQPNELARQLRQLHVEADTTAKHFKRGQHGPRRGWRGADYVAWCIARTVEPHKVAIVGNEGGHFVLVVEAVFAALYLDDAVGAAKRMEKAHDDLGDWKFETLFPTVFEISQSG